MPAQVSSTDKIIFPDGVAFEVSTDEGASYTNIGVLAGGATATYNYDKIVVESGNAGTLRNRIKNQTIAMAPSALYNWEPDVMESWGGGAFNLETVAGTPVSGATQVITSGNWEFDKGILFAGQNDDGTVPTVNSVTGSTDGAGAADDYTTVKGPGGWYLVPLDGTNFTTESQSLTIDYDYTPSASKKLTGGTSSIELTKFWARLRHYTDDSLTQYDMEMIVYGVDIDSGLQFGFKGANEDGVHEITVAFTGNVDITRDDGKQLFELTINSDAYSN